MEGKVCSICTELKSFDDYYGQKKIRKDGTEYVYYPPYCKKCTVKKTMDWEKNNPEKRKIAQAIYYQKPHAKQKKKEKQREKIAKGVYSEWQRKNKDKIKSYTIFRSMNKTHEITNKEWIECKEYFDNKCAYCGMSEKVHKEQFKQRLHKEHVDHNGSNKIDNCVPACKVCNSLKHQYPLEEWYTPERDFFLEERLFKIYQWLQSDHKLIQI